MSSAVVQFGAEIATPVPASSHNSKSVPLSAVKTTGDLLTALKQDPPASFGMMKTTCGHLGTYLNLPGDQIALDMVEATKAGFRHFLASRNYAENSIRGYVSQVGSLLKAARKFGWDPDLAISNIWKDLLTRAAENEAMGLTKHFSRITTDPSEITIEALEQWEDSKIQQGTYHTSARRARNRFVRFLHRAGWTSLNPPGMQNKENYGIPVRLLAPGLRGEVEALLKWKQAEFAPGRPKKGKIRPVSAQKLREFFGELAGYAINICGVQPKSLHDLLQQELVTKFVGWIINERAVRTRSFRCSIGMLFAAIRYYPACAPLDLDWLKKLIDSIPAEDESERKQRKAGKVLDYEVLEAIPGKIRAELKKYERGRSKNAKYAAQLAMEELIMRWLTILPWRQRNLRQCRIGGNNPNLFKGRIPSSSGLDKPAWVLKEEAKNPNAEFWQIRFSTKETKTHIAIHVLLPRQLIAPLEHYLTEHRPHLVTGQDPQTLFLNRHGKPLDTKIMQRIVGYWSLRYGGGRTTPHLVRDAIAFKWLKEHPEDYLTLSKMLWHKNIETTINTYGSQFNESSGVSAMEAWLDERADAGDKT